MGTKLVTQDLVQKQMAQEKQMVQERQKGKKETEREIQCTASMKQNTKFSVQLKVNGTKNSVYHYSTN